MPNQNSDQNNPVSVISPQSDLPPMPPAFQNVVSSSGSSAPSEEPTTGSSNLPPVIPETPHKKFGGGRVIATLLGILLLVVGVGTGLLLTQQQQLFQQKANVQPPECFPAGTKITLENGTKVNIEDVKSGDRVLSQNSNGEKTLSTVQSLNLFSSSNMCDIRFTDNENLKLTNPHPLYTRKGWSAINVPAAVFHNPGLAISQLVIGDFVAREDGTWDQIASISCTQGSFNVYNLSVDNNHDYFAEGFLAHNKYVPPPSKPPGGGGGGGGKTPTPPSSGRCPCGYCSGLSCVKCASGCRSVGDCGSNTDCGSGTPPPKGGGCTTGSERACTLPGGGAGTQYCRNSQWSGCEVTQGKPGNPCYNGTCDNGYTCKNNVCVGNTNTVSCGRNTDPGAPVCCTDKNCTGGTKVCEAPGRYECKSASGTHCTIETNSGSCGGGTPPPKTPPPSTPPPGITAQCKNVQAYDSAWVLLTSADLSQLIAGSKINFCVTGATTGGSFDMARFTINTVPQGNTTTKRPASNDFCQAYVVPAATYAFTVSAQIHHVTLGWSN